MSLGSG